MEHNFLYVKHVTYSSPLYLTYSYFIKSSPLHAPGYIEELNVNERLNDASSLLSKLSGFQVYSTFEHIFTFERQRCMDESNLE